MKFIVSADHVAPEYRLVDCAFAFNWADGFQDYHVCKDAGADTYSADGLMFGSGKSYATPEAAIRGLLASNGCTNIRIEKEPEPVAPGRL